MAAYRLDNPFPEYGYFGSEYFCDREQETEQLTKALLNGSNVTLMAPRRIGKTGLIHHVFERMKAKDKRVQCFYVDIFSTKTFDQMVEFIANAVMGKHPITGMPTFSFTIAPENARQTLQQVFEYMKESELPCYLAIDEFQQISTYNEIGADAFIHSIIQFVPNVHIIFSGSQQHLLADLFMSPKHPFFNSSQIMVIKEINIDRYRDFANGFFARQKRAIPADVFAYLYQTVDGQTWYIQKILNRLYRNPDEEITEKAVLNAINTIIAEQEITYQSNYHLLTENQARLLTAIATQGTVSAPTASEFIHRYRLPAPSSIKQAVSSLIEKEFLYHDPQRGYMVYDRFFGMWLKRLA